MASILDAFKEKHSEERVYEGKKIKVGIIGCGWIAEAHLKSYLKCEDVEVVAFADIVPGKAEEFAKANGVEGRYYLSDKELIDNEKDLENIDPAARQALNFVFCKSADDVLRTALVENTEGFAHKTKDCRDNTKNKNGEDLSDYIPSVMTETTSVSVNA